MYFLASEGLDDGGPAWVVADIGKKICFVSVPGESDGGIDTATADMVGNPIYIYFAAESEFAENANIAYLCSD